MDKDLIVIFPALPVLAASIYTLRRLAAIEAPILPKPARPNFLFELHAILIEEYNNISRVRYGNNF